MPVVTQSCSRRFSAAAAAMLNSTPMTMPATNDMTHPVEVGLSCQGVSGVKVMSLRNESDSPSGRLIGSTHNQEVRGMAVTGIT